MNTPSRLIQNNTRWLSGIRRGASGPQPFWIAETSALGSVRLPWEPQQVFVISLARRPDRLRRFRQNLASIHWSWPAPQLLTAIDGRWSGVPAWWRDTTGSWACLRSHEAVLSAAYRKGAASVLVFEDDAMLVDDFNSRLMEFLRQVPDDWDGLMLGGRHDERPQRISSSVVRCKYTIHAHCYALRNPALVQILEAYAHGREPVDHVLARLMSRLVFYAPSPFLAGQAGGRSDISERNLPFRI